VKPVILSMLGNEALAAALATSLADNLGVVEQRQFPDGETYLRVHAEAAGRSVVIACTLNEPDGKVLPLLFAADALRDLGAVRIGLAAPYLAYMRQDARFRDGEAVTSRTFARLFSRSFDWIVTVDPHLHRYRSMDEIYGVPVAVGHGAPVLADYLRGEKGSMFLVGPDEESEQWVAAVARDAGVPHVTMKKTRHGDRDVSIAFSGIDGFRGRVPVLVDDMISSGRTMEVASRQLVDLGFPAPVCLAVHGILAEDARARLEAAGAKVVTTNTIPGPTTLLDIHPVVAELVRGQLQAGAARGPSAAVPPP
jgi:ribose-phosphate pyrophosphokinase